ncbi:MAG: hypothetical protein JWQ38_2387 [Flavipsychrobacter sp.]|nr:hypothetical protein [Flavipsychrobacter sp.]
MVQVIAFIQCLIGAMQNLMTICIFDENMPIWKFH